MKKEPQPIDYAVHTLAGYSNPQTTKVGGLLKQQPINVLIDTSNTNNFLNSKVAARMVLQIKENYQDSAREFARRRPRLAGKLSGVTENLVGSSDDTVGSRWKFARRFTEGIGKLAKNAKGDCREEDRRTYREIAGGCRIMRKLGLI
ncbi:hypothetical protein BHE74_00049445 [Ensete ventricosum]|nr:hypothetical protein BHE74_00049445 [Ensete ventricosum]